MVRHPNSLVEQAKQLSSTGKYTYREIGDMLNVSNSSISSWCLNTEGSKVKFLLDHYKEKRNAFIDSEKQIINQINEDISHSKLYCSILYGCEGAKYPATSLVSFTNSDPEVIKIFVVLLRKSFSLDESKWRVLLQIHSNQIYNQLVAYWSRLLSISPDSFYKPTITSPDGGKHKKKYFGTCSVRYSDYRLQLKLIGIFSEFLRKFTQ